MFFTVVGVDPLEVSTADVYDFIRAQRSPRGDGVVVRLSDGSSGLALSTVKRRLSSVSGFYRYLIELGEVNSNPVHRGMAHRSSGGGRSRRVTPLVRPARRLPQILSPGEVDELVAALRTRRDQGPPFSHGAGGLDERGEAGSQGPGDPPVEHGDGVARFETPPSAGQPDSPHPHQCQESP